jgi:SAM-dependent methyltransferase
MQDHLARLSGKGLVLDLGCGNGFWLARMNRLGVRAIGLEPDLPKALEASRHAPVAVGDGCRLPLADASVDLVWCVHVAHHVSSPQLLLAEAHRVLRPGGHLLLAETVEDNPFIRLARSLRPSWDRVPVRSRFRAAALLEMLRDNGFEVTASRRHSVLALVAWMLPVAQGRVWLGLAAAEERHLASGHPPTPPLRRSVSART